MSTQIQIKIGKHQIDEIFVIAFAYDATTGNGYSHTIEVLRLTVYIN